MAGATLRRHIARIGGSWAIVRKEQREWQSDTPAKIMPARSSRECIGFDLAPLLAKIRRTCDVGAAVMAD